MATDPKLVRAWMGIFRDFAMTTLAGFMLVYETVVIPVPNVYIIGASLTLFGIPPALRLDQNRRSAGSSEE